MTVVKVHVGNIVTDLLYVPYDKILDCMLLLLTFKVYLGSAIILVQFGKKSSFSFLFFHTFVLIQFHFILFGFPF